MSRESKAELTDRLRREGRFEAFKARREELKRQGTPAGEAWPIAAEEFAPLEDRKTSDDGGSASGNLSDADTAALLNKVPAPLPQVIGWVFNALDLHGLRPIDAPSTGAWSLLTWARSNARNRTVFYTVFVPKLLLGRSAGKDGMPYDFSAPSGRAQGEENEACDPLDELFEKYGKSD
jgi:hypothetical protein